MADERRVHLDDPAHPRRRAVLRALAGWPLVPIAGCTVLDRGYTAESTVLVPAGGDSEDLFGRSVDVSGDIALVGAFGDDDPNGAYGGAAYLFERTDDGWTGTATFAAADGDRDDFFGDSVALTEDGSTVLVGAPHDMDADRDRSGAAYLFERTGDTWTRTATFEPTREESGGNDGSSRPEGAPSEFGASVALSRGAALVGAYRDENPGPEDAGVAYVFERTDDGWSRTATLSPDDGDAGDYFGVSVAMADDTALIGAYRDEDPNGEDAGAAYVFERRTDGWIETAKLVPDDGDDGDFFGGAVALAADTALVGAPDEEAPNGAGAGAAYVFERTGGGWTETAKLVPDDGDAGDHFGGAVALADSGDRALVGAGDEDTNGADAGAAYVFSRTDGDWGQTSKLAPGDGDTDDHFGRAVALSGTTALVGAYRDDENGDDSGAAYVFDLGSS